MRFSAGMRVADVAGAIDTGDVTRVCCRRTYY
jgi:hypothetical protein